MSAAVFLQGPHGPFFARLAKKLSEYGVVTHKINFNGGDRYFAWADFQVNFTGIEDDWPFFFRQYLLEKGANVTLIEGLLGHAGISTTESYLSLLPRHLRDAVDLLDITTENSDATTIKLPTLPKLLKPKPVYKPEIVITDANKRIYVDENGNVFEV